MTSNYVPLGGVIILETFCERAYSGGHTYSGYDLACATAVAMFNAMKDESMAENAAQLCRDIIGPALDEMAEPHPGIGEVRSGGSSGPWSLVKDPETREPLAPYGGSSPGMNDVVAAVKAGGVLPFANFNRIHVVPALNIPDELLREGSAVLDRALDTADATPIGQTRWRPLIERE